MEFLLSFPTTIAASTIFTFIIIFIIIILVALLQHGILYIPNLANKTQRASRTAPQVARAWPIIGHLHLLGGARQPYIFLGDMANKYGPIFSLKFGVHQAFVVSDWKLAKECFKTNDKTFVGRPKSATVELMGYNYAMYGLGPYGSYWGHMTRIMHDILSNKQVQELFAQIRVSEVRSSTKEIYNLWAKNSKDCSSSSTEMVKVEMQHWFENLTLNMVVRMIASKRYKSEDEEGSQSLKTMKKFFELMGASVVSDAIPFLRWFDIGGYLKEMKKTGKEIDDILSRWIEEHKRKKANVSNMQVLESEEKQDFMDVMMTILQHSSEKDLAYFDADIVNKATCLTILAGSADTTAVTLTWALSLLLNNRHALEKAREELNTHVRRERQVEESDIKNLVYLQAIVKETLRLYPPAPLSPPRESIADCTVGGYNIPKGSRLIMNLSKIHRDPQVWMDPYEFRPERFFTAQKYVDIRGHHFELLPFGSGRRMCPGISLAMQIVLLTLASVIHGFDLSTPMNEPVDLSEGFGLLNVKAIPLEILVKPRLSKYE